MPNLERKLPKLAALAAPAFVWLAANACDIAGSKLPPTPQDQATGRAVNPEIPKPTIAPKEKISTPAPSPIATPFREKFFPTPRIQDTQIQAIYNAELDVLVITDRNYQYEIIPNWSFEDVINERSKHWLERYLPPETISAEWEKLTKAQQVDSQNPNDPQIFSLAQEAISILTPFCDKSYPSSTRGTVRGHVKGIASALYNKDPQNWHQYRDFFINHPCFTVKKL